MEWTDAPSQGARAAARLCDAPGGPTAIGYGGAPRRREVILARHADEDGVGGDNSADALRYLVASKNAGGVIKKLRGLSANAEGGAVD